MPRVRYRLASPGQICVLHWGGCDGEVPDFVQPHRGDGQPVRREAFRPGGCRPGAGGVVGGGLECYYWMLGQYDGMAVCEFPDSHTAAAVSLAAASSGAFAHFETHELIEASDLAGIAERARGITYQPPGA